MLPLMPWKVLYGSSGQPGSNKSRFSPGLQDPLHSLGCCSQQQPLCQAAPAHGTAPHPWHEAPWRFRVFIFTHGLRKTSPRMSFSLPSAGAPLCSPPACREDLSLIAFTGKSLTAFPSKLKIQAAISSSFLSWPKGTMKHQTSQLLHPLKEGFYRGEQSGDTASGHPQGSLCWGMEFS